MTVKALQTNIVFDLQGWLSRIKALLAAGRNPLRENREGRRFESCPLKGVSAWHFLHRSLRWFSGNYNKPHGTPANPFPNF